MRTLITLLEPHVKSHSNCFKTLVLGGKPKEVTLTPSALLPLGVRSKNAMLIFLKTIDQQVDGYSITFLERLHIES